jgi:hypothetical protein
VVEVVYPATVLIDLPEELSCPASPTSTSQYDALPPGQVLSIALPLGRGSRDGVGSCRECRPQPGVKEQFDLVDCAVVPQIAEHLVVHVLKPGYWIFRKRLARNTAANKLTESHAHPIATRLQSRSYGDRVAAFIKREACQSVIVGGVADTVITPRTASPRLNVKLDLHLTGLPASRQERSGQRNNCQPGGE